MVRHHQLRLISFIITAHCFDSSSILHLFTFERFGTGRTVERIHICMSKQTIDTASGVFRLLSIGPTLSVQFFCAIQFGLEIYGPIRQFRATLTSLFYFCDFLYLFTSEFFGNAYGWWTYISMSKLQIDIASGVYVLSKDVNWVNPLDIFGATRRFWAALTSLILLGTHS